jgi:predicted transcriptional regulator
MSTIEIKNELHQIIDNSDANFVKSFYEIIKDFIAKTDTTAMIQESEDDIKAGRIHSLNDVKKTIESWKE